MKNVLICLVCLFSIVGISSCKKDDKTDPVPVNPTPLCDATKTPVVMVHGSLASGDTYARHAMRFEQNSYCSNRIFAFDWNSTAGNTAAALVELDSTINAIRQKTGASKVHLMGHSAGAGLVYSYCNDSARASKVSKLVYIGGNAQSTIAGPNAEIPTLNIYSDGDLVVTGGGDIPGATNVHLTDEDHYEVATSRASFEAIYNFFENMNPQYPNILPTAGDIILSGKAVVLGENTPVTGALVQIYEVNASTGQRIGGFPAATFTVSEKGTWGPFAAKKDAVYEYRVKGTGPADRAVHYFREKAIRSNQLIYLRTIPTSFPLSFFFTGFPSDAFPALGVFAASQAIINNRDVLTVDGTLLTGTTYFDASRTTIAAFLFDGNTNQTTDLTDAGLFNLQGVFLAGIDMFFQQNTTALPLVFNGRTLNVRRIPSSEGVTVPVFE